MRAFSGQGGIEDFPVQSINGTCLGATRTEKFEIRAMFDSTLITYSTPAVIIFLFKGGIRSMND